MNLVGGSNPSEKYWSIGVIIHHIWKNHVPNHQPNMDYLKIGYHRSAASTITAGQSYSHLQNVCLVASVMEMSDSYGNSRLELTMVPATNCKPPFVDDLPSFLNVVFL